MGPSPTGSGASEAEAGPTPQPVRSTGTVILATSIVFGLVVIGIITGFVLLQRGQLLSRAEADSRSIVTALQEHAQRTFDLSYAIADEALALVQGRGGVDTLLGNEAAHRELAALAARLPVSGVIWIIDASGKPVLMSDHHPAVRVDLSDRAWFKAHAERGEEWHIGEALFSRVNFDIYFILSRIIRGEDGTFQGVVELGLQTSRFTNSAFAPEYGRQTSLAMLRDDGRIIARYPFPIEQIGKSAKELPIFSQFSGQARGTFRSFSPVDGVERVSSFARLDRLPLVVVAGVALSDVLESWWTMVRWSAALATAVLAALAGLTWHALRASRDETRARVALEQALADKETLFNEVHHRVKNNLQVTASLLRLQGRRFSDPEVRSVFQETQARLQSIALVHETVYQTDNPSQVDLTAYLARLVDSLALSYGAHERDIRFVLDLEAVRADLNQAVPLALTVTEVVTNALKHAFPESGGDIRLTLRRDGNQGELEIRDTGRGIDLGQRSQQSLGLTLVDALVSQLRGRHQVVADSGTVFRLSWPILPAKRLPGAPGARA